MKKIKIILVSLIAFCLLLTVAAIAVLKIYFPEEKIKSYITEYSKNNLNREISLDKISFTFVGITLHNFAMSEKTTFNDGTFIKANHLTVKVALLPLITKKIQFTKIICDGAEVYIIKDKDGIFNFADFTNNEQKSNEEENKKEDTNKQSNISFEINKLDIKDSKISYKDLTENLTYEISKTNLSLSDFSLNDYFKCKGNFDITYIKDTNELVFPLEFDAKINLNNFNFDKFSVEINSLLTKIKETEFDVSGKVFNLNKPEIKLNLSIKNLSNEAFSILTDSPLVYCILELNFVTEATIDLSSKTADIQKFSLNLPDSKAELKGLIGWDKDNMQYDFDMNLDVSLNQLQDFFPQYNLNGKLKSVFKANQNLIDGTLDLQNISVSVSSINITNLNSNATIKLNTNEALHKIDFRTDNDIKDIDIKISNLSAKINNSLFSANGSITKPDKILADINCSVENLSSKDIKTFYDLQTDIVIDKITAQLNSLVNMQTKTAKINKLNIALNNSTADISGNIDWNNTLKYNLNIAANLTLNQFIKSLTKQDVSGNINTKLYVTNNDFSGNVNLNKVSFFYQDCINFKDVNLQAVLKSKNNISVQKATGKFNDGSFDLAGSFINKTITIKLAMDKLIMEKFPQFEQEKPTNNKNTKTTASKKQQSTGFNINLNTDVKISTINIPYFYAKNFTLKTALNSITETCSKLSGTANCNFNDGEITNVSTFATNKTAKSLLNIFIIANNIKGTSANSSKDSIHFDRFILDAVSTNGNLQINRGNFKMPITAIDVTGTVNFANRNLNLSVVPAEYTAFKITGTIEEPKTNFDLGKAVTNALKSENVINQLSNLFGGGKKEDKTKTDTSTTTANTSTEQKQETSKQEAQQTTETKVINQLSNLLGGGKKDTNTGSSESKQETQQTSEEQK